MYIYAAATSIETREETKSYINRGFYTLHFSSECILQNYCPKFRFEAVACWAKGTFSINIFLLKEDRSNFYYEIHLAIKKRTAKRHGGTAEILYKQSFYKHLININCLKYLRLECIRSGLHPT